MDKGNQDLSSENTEEFVPEQQGATASSGENQSASTASLGESQTAYTSEASSLAQQTGGNFGDVSSLQNQFQRHLQTPSARNILASISERQESTASYGERQLASTSEASSYHSQQVSRCTDSASPSQIQLRQNIQASLSGNTPAFDLQRFQSTANLCGSQTEASSSHSQQSTGHLSISSLLKYAFQPLSQTSVLRNPPASFPVRPNNFSFFVPNQSVSTSHVPFFRPQQTGRHPTGINPSQTQIQHNQRTSFAKKALPSVPDHPETSASLIKDKSASNTPSNIEERFPIIVSRLSTPPKRTFETSLHESGQCSSIEITSPSKKRVSSPQPTQKTITLYLPADFVFSRTHETSVSAKPKTKTLSSPIETTNLEYEENKDPEFVDTTFSPEETTDSFQTENEPPKTSSIFQQQSSTLSHEVSLKNSPFQPSKSLQGTKIKKDVSRLENRLVLFDKFICVKCFGEFATQDELLRHEPIHFND